MTISRIPARTRFSMCQAINGLPPTSNSGLGVRSVSGRMRSPRPAAKSIAIIGLCLSRLLFLPLAGESWIGGDAQHHGFMPFTIARLRPPRYALPACAGGEHSEGDLDRGRCVASKCVALFANLWLQYIEQIQQRLEVDVACASGAQIRHHQRQIFQVAVLAVAVIQARENAQYLEMTLHTHPFVIAVEHGEIIGHRQASLARFFPIAYQPVDHFCFFPTDVGILEQRGEIVGDRAIHGILKIQYARVRFGDHQIARVVVAMHVHARLGEVVGDDARKDSFQFGVLRLAERDIEMLGDVPLREQEHLAQQQGFVIGRQFVFARGELDFDQRVRGRTVKFFRSISVTSAQSLQISGVAEVGQQQKALFEVMRINMRHMRSGLLEQFGYVQERAAILVLRRGIHHDQRALRVGDAEVAAEAGIGRCRGDSERLVGDLAVQPLGKLLLALHIGFSNVLNVKLAGVYHLTILLRVMRFLFKYPFILLLVCFAQHSYAGEDLPDLRTDKNPQTVTATSQEGPAVIEADSLVGKTKDQIEATGDVTLRQGGQSIRADSLLFNQSSHEVDAQGAVMLKQDGNTMTGPHLLFNMDKSTGTMEQLQFYLKENNSRGSADELHIQDRQHFSLDNATYTTCPAGNQDWQLNMGLLEIDRDRQIGVAHSASVEFKGVPILYSPWMDFPLNGQSKSGFLAPTIGGTVSSGYEVTLPYYWNIAPNFDATVAPREMTKRGLMLNNEFRYLEPGYGGELHVDVLPNDALAKRSRELFSLIHNQTLASSLTSYVNFTRVGDDAYFRDLGNAVNVTSQSNLLQEGGLNYDAGWWTAVARVQHYQTLQDPAAPILVPYTRLPQLTLNARQNHADANIEFAGEYVNFSHPTLVNGSRLVLNPSVSYPLVSEPAFYVTPKVALHSTYYVMGANNTPVSPNTSAFQNASRTLPILSVDSGVAFERESNLFNNDYVQTLEPRAFYVYVPYKDQSLLPNFDSALADVNFTQLFMEN